MMLNGWAALALIVVIVAICFLVSIIISMRHDEKMMILKIEEIKATIEKNRREHTKTDKKKVGRKKKENK